MKRTTVQLGEFLTLKRGYDLPERARVPGQVPVVSSSGITGTHKEAKVEGPGVVTGRYGTLGEVFYIEEPFWPLNTALYVEDFKGNHRRFVAYFLKSILKGTQSDKAAVPGVNRNDLHARKVDVPDDLSEQEAIASTLSAYDDLIENNLRRIGLLEEAARLLYREWFVHLRFPGHEHVTVVDGVPGEWERKLLSDMVDTQYGFTETATNEPLGPKFLRGTDINKTAYIDWSTVPHCPDDKLDFKKYELGVGDIVVIRMADPGKVAIVESDVKAVFASYLVRLTRKEGVPIPPLYLFYVLSGDKYRSFISRASGGATRKSASAKLLVEFDVLIPPPIVVSMFIELIEPLRSQIQILLQQTACLRQARDLLLPRLMNGEVAV